MGYFGLLCIAGIAVVCDFHSGKIPNELILAGFCMAFLWQITEKGLPGIPSALTGCFLALVLLAPLHYFRMLGAGDIKLLMTAGAFLGVSDLIKLILFSFLAAAMISLAVLIRHRILKRRLSYLIQYLQQYFHTGNWEPYIRDDENVAYIHFSVPVFLGCIALFGGML